VQVFVRRPILRGSDEPFVTVESVKLLVVGTVGGISSLRCGWGTRGRSAHPCQRRGHHGRRKQDPGAENLRLRRECASAPTVAPPAPV